VFLEGQDQVEGAKMGVHGVSLALPSVVHELLQRRDTAELKANKLFFVHYNRGRLEESEKGWYDLASMHQLRCLVVYPSALPRSPDVHVIASCPITLPVIDGEAVEAHKTSLRKVRKGLLEVIAANEKTAATKLADLEAMTEDLVDRVGQSDCVEVMLYVLGFEYEGVAQTHPAIVIRNETFTHCKS
jgi:hypothetical protein